jgi:putative spermidine/putrescine transport system substrate-binding protein
MIAKWVSPAAKAAGVQLQAQTWNGDMGAFATRIRRGVNTWDLVHVEMQDAYRPDRKELFHTLTARGAARLEDAYRQNPVVAEGLAMPNYEWGYVLAYRTDVIGRTPAQPLSWPALWDLQRYPGRRGIRDWPIGAIEIALQSLGRDPRVVLYDAKLSRADIERQVSDALKRLSVISKQTVWWETGDQVQRGLISGDMAFAAGFTGRTGSAFQELCPGVASAGRPCKLAVNPATAMVVADWWIVPRGAKNAEAADALLRAMFSDAHAAQGASAFASARGYHVPIQDLRVEGDVVREFVEMGSSRNATALTLDPQFWGANFSWIMERWRVWRSEQ